MATRYKFRFINESQLIEAAALLVAEKMANYGDAFTRPEDAKKLFRLRLANKQHEEMHIAYLDNQHRLIQVETHTKGTIDGARVYPRTIAQAALKLNAAAVILAHNHPSGATEPSGSDERVTRDIKAVLDLIDVRLLDHLIIGDSTTSFAERGLL